jgi:hypothetical protein
LQVVALPGVGYEAQRVVVRRGSLRRSFGKFEEVSAYGVVAVMVFEPVIDHREHLEAGIVAIDQATATARFTVTRGFPASRRARITPAQVGMPTDDEKRRVRRLRREEIASLARVSFDYYRA